LHESEKTKITPEKRGERDQLVNTHKGKGMCKLNVKLRFTEFPIPSFIEGFGLSFREFPRLVGRYCSSLLTKQERGTPKTKHDKVSRTMGWETLDFPKNL